jgi:hypothetical protein
LPVKVLEKGLVGAIDPTGRYAPFIRIHGACQEQILQRLPASIFVPMISAKPDGVGAAFQPWIPTGEQSGLLTLIVTTGSVSLCERMKS